MELDDFYRTQYENEISRRYQLSSSLGIPIGIVSVVGGALLAMAQGLSVPLDAYEIATLILVIAAAASAVTVGVFLYRFQFGHAYSYIATTEQVENYRTGLVRYYSSRGANGTAVDGEVKSYLRDEYIHCAHVNALKNDRKTGFLGKAYAALAAFVVLASLASLPYTIDKVVSPQQGDSTRIEIKVG